MAIEVRPLSPILGAEILDIDAANLSDDEFAIIHKAHLDYGVIVLRDQHLNSDQHIAFSRRFGDLDYQVLDQYSLPGHREILVLSNKVEDGKPLGLSDGGRRWHTDMSYTARPPRATLLYALEVPIENGVVLGDTNFSSAADAHDSLPNETRQRIAGLRAIHQVAGRRARTGTGKSDQALRQAQPVVVHPVARTHPHTGRKCLYVSKGECEGIEGLPKDEALALIDELADRTIDPRFQHTHRWQVRDLLMWDNCTVQHLASFDYHWPQHRRLMHRVTVDGSIPV